MIAKISGTLTHKLASSVIVDVAGVGYEIFTTVADLMSMNQGDAVELFIAENIKEDEHTLYGFKLLLQRTLYFTLTTVNGVGPKAAMAILSANSPTEIEEAIASEDISVFSKVSGIGQKTAQRILLDLKGKLVAPADSKLNTDDPAYQALISLGYTAKDAQSALVDVPAGDTNERVRQALKGMSR